MQMFRVCFAKRLSGKQQALDYDWDMLIPSNIRLELQTPRVERCVVCCFVWVDGLVGTFRLGRVLDHLDGLQRIGVPALVDDLAQNPVEVM